MSGISAGAAQAIATKFPWADYKTFMDVGAAQGMVPVTLARLHPHLMGIGFDLPQVRPVFEEFVAKEGLSDRVRFHEGNFFDDDLPQADVIIMGHISIFRMSSVLASRAAVSRPRSSNSCRRSGLRNRTWPVRAFGPCTGQTRRPSPDPLPAFRRPRRSTGRSVALK